MFGIYLHWPFCRSKCPYCDFNSHVADTISHADWRAAYEQEISHTASLTPDHIVTSIYFGGGTPSLMEPQTSETVLNAISKNWRMANDVEITLEANPTSIEQQKFRDFKQAGINRVSIGVQALNDADLKFLGRQHSALEAKKALDIANQTFNRVNFDLIYARPNQTALMWEAELHEALQLAKAGHLSLYQLTIERGTAFETMYQRREFSLPDDDLGAQLYEMTAEIATSHGLNQYEVSNYARSGEESLHNMTYWHYEDYAGIGPGAHGRLTINGEKYATRTHRAPKIWMERVNKNYHGLDPMDKLEHDDRLIECLLMGLRIKEGVSFDKLETEGGKDWRKKIDWKKLDALAAEGYISRTEKNLSPTSAGIQRLNRVLEDILV